MKNSTKTVLAVGFLALLSAGTVGLIANARNMPNSEVRMAGTHKTEVHKGSQLRAREDSENEAQEGPEDEAQEAQEVAKYKSLAKITPDQAQKAAEKAHGGTASKVTLDEDDGSLVYEVQIGNAEIAVDAGNGKILKTERKGQEENEATEAKVRGSIQVPDTDQEQNDN